MTGQIAVGLFWGMGLLKTCLATSPWDFLGDGSSKTCLAKSPWDWPHCRLSFSGDGSAKSLPGHIAVALFLGMGVLKNCLTGLPWELFAVTTAEKETPQMLPTLARVRLLIGTLL